VRVDWFTGEIDLDHRYTDHSTRSSNRPQKLRRLRFVAGRLVSDEIVAPS
jgi:hypothetical protein